MSLQNYGAAAGFKQYADWDHFVLSCLPTLPADNSQDFFYAQFAFTL